MSMKPLELDEIRRVVISRFGTIHAFAKGRPGGLARSTVYQVLSGKYGGDTEHQLGRINAALGEARSGIFEILKEVACGRCRKKRRRTRQCEKCFDLNVSARCVRGMIYEERFRSTKDKPLRIPVEDIRAEVKNVDLWTSQSEEMLDEKARMMV